MENKDLITESVVDEALETLKTYGSEQKPSRSLQFFVQLHVNVAHTISSLSENCDPQFQKKCQQLKAMLNFFLARTYWNQAQDVSSLNLALSKSYFECLDAECGSTEPIFELRTTGLVIYFRDQAGKNNFAQYLQYFNLDIINPPDIIPEPFYLYTVTIRHKDVCRFLCLYTKQPENDIKAVKTAWYQQNGLDGESHSYLANQTIGNLIPDIVLLLISMLPPEDIFSWVGLNRTMRNLIIGYDMFWALKLKIHFSFELSKNPAQHENMLTGLNDPYKWLITNQKKTNNSRSLSRNQFETLSYYQRFSCLYKSDYFSPLPHSSFHPIYRELFFWANEDKLAEFKIALQASKIGALTLLGNRRGLSPLDAAAESGSLSIVQYLVEEKQASPCEKTLELAAQNGHTEISKCFNLHKEKEALSVAIGKNDLAAVKSIVEKGTIDLKQPIYLNFKALYLAARDGHIEVVKYLIEEQNLDPAEQNAFSAATLHSIDQSFELLKYFIENDGTFLISNHISFLLEITNDSKDTLLHVAAERGDTAVITFLAKHLTQNNVDPTNIKGKTPLFLAVENGHLEIIKILTSLGANAELTYNSFQPRHVALENNYNAVAQFLIAEKKVDVNQTTNYNETPLCKGQDPAATQTISQLDAITTGKSKETSNRADSNSQQPTPQSRITPTENNTFEKSASSSLYPSDMGVVPPTTPSYKIHSVSATFGFLSLCIMAGLFTLGGMMKGLELSAGNPIYDVLTTVLSFLPWDPVISIFVLASLFLFISAVCAYTAVDQVKEPKSTQPDQKHMQLPTTIDSTTPHPAGQHSAKVFTEAVRTPKPEISRDLPNTPKPGAEL